MGGGVMTLHMFLFGSRMRALRIAGRGATRMYRSDGPI
jgi:hypothetical protein